MKIGGKQVQHLQQFTPEQMQIFQNMGNQIGGGSYTSRLAGGDPSLFAEMEAPAMRQFQDLQGQTASRFSGAGMGARRGSGFKNEMNQQTSNFAQDLQSKRQELQRQAIMDLMGMSSNFLSQKPYETMLVEPEHKKGFLEQLFGGGMDFLNSEGGMDLFKKILPMLMSAGGTAFGGPLGGMAAGASGNRMFK
jgi:hypothetical protein